MATHEPSQVSTDHSLRPTVEPDPYRSSAVRVAGTYLLLGLLWIALSDLSLAGLGALSASGFLWSMGKGAAFVLSSAGLVFWLCQREYRNTSQAMALLRTVVLGTSDAVFVKDREGRYQLVNAAAARFLGLSVADVLGRNDRELFESTEAEQLMANDQAIIAGGKDVTVEETVTSVGVTRTYQTTKGPYFDATGAAAGLIGIGRDVTERVLMEAALRESDARLREAQRIARLGSWSWEPPTNRVWWSDAEFELLSADPKVVRPSFEAFLEFLHPDDRIVAIARVEAMRVGSNEFASDLRVVRADGTWMWIHSQARATRDSAGNLIRVEGIDQDITAQRLAQQAALESERRLQAAVEVAELGVIVIDYEQSTADLSATAAEQFGLPAGKVARFELHSRFHPDDGGDLTKLLEDALDPAGSGWFTAEHRVVRPDGTTRWLNVRKQISFVDGRPYAAVVVTVDVTERRNAEARIREQEMLVREAAELAKVGGWGFDPVTLDADWTPEVARMFGLGPVGPASLAAALDYINPEHTAAVEAAIEAARKDAIPHDMELELHAADGQTRWVRTICRPIVEGGRVTRVRGSLQDITDRKRAEADLRASEERYRLLFESNPHPMWLYDVESLRFLAVNDAAVLTYGYTREEFMAMTLRDIRPEAEVPKLESAVARTTRGLSLASEWKHKRKNGTIFDVDVSSHD
ncbi:MAG: PAS domain S-box protein, partial [Pirellulaceae bacterium]|nr:PAS domain S-box protein [Pirellulaceae bacterium]